MADRINTLPAHVLVNIVARLPFRDAVRTSAISRIWRNIWASIPDLVFDYHSGSLTFRLDYEIIIYQAVLNRQAPINKFVLSVPHGMSHSFLDHLIMRLSRDPVQHFTLCVNTANRYRITSHLFAFREIRNLWLASCHLTPPPEFQGFNALVKVALLDVQLLPAAFERFISHCPSLEHVYLSGCSCWDSVEVVGPSLRIFRFHGFVNSIHFKTCPLLAEVTLCTPIVGHSVFRRPCGCFHLMTIQPLPENVHLYPRLLQFTNAGGEPNQFANLIVLDLSMSLARTEEVTGVLSFIRHSPILETLKLRLCQSDWVAVVFDFILGLEKPNPYMNRLRRIELRCYIGTVHQIELVKYLLAAAAGLVEMVVVPAFYHQHFVHLEEYMRQFPWASPAARLIVRWSHQN